MIAHLYRLPSYPLDDSLLNSLLLVFHLVLLLLPYLVERFYLQTDGFSNKAMEGVISSGISADLLKILLHSLV